MPELGVAIQVTGTGAVIHVGNLGVPLSAAQADELYRQLGHALQELHMEEQYEEYLERQGLTHEEAMEVMLNPDAEVIQIDQGTGWLQ